MQAVAVGQVHNKIQQMDLFLLEGALVATLLNLLRTEQLIREVAVVQLMITLLALTVVILMKMVRVDQVSSL
tara:strand:- start:14 stop:229 length:216 start_codon:yes stop_codon:yes gene_type:complete